MALVDDFRNDEKMILRDHLAIERTKLANERTLLSYIRTSLYLLTVGVGIFQIESVWHLKGVGWACIMAGVLILAVGLFRFILMKRHLKSYLD